MKDIVYRELSLDDGQRINELYAYAYGQARPFSHWQWEYQQAPFARPLLWGAECGARLVGHYAFIPFQMSSGHRLFWGAKAESAMVHPDFRGKGICSSLVNQALQAAAQSGIDIIWGFPNEQSFQIMQRSGRRYIGGLNSFIRIYRPLRVLKMYFRQRVGWAGSRCPFGGDSCTVDKTSSHIVGRKRRMSPATLIKLDRFDEDVDHLWEQTGAHVGISITRTSQYLNWRFIQNPHGNYEILAALDSQHRLTGYMISQLKLELNCRVGYIVDFLVSHENATIFRHLLYATLHQMRDDGADMVWLFVNRGCRVYGLIESIMAGHHLRPWRSEKKFAVKIFPHRFSAAEGYDIRNWFLTGAFAEGVEF